ncbi:MAG: glycosyltransferase family 2 protein [Chloroflexi bacterium]|nr:glycosyltransferase family 2 protein [Chloroflexota bacterium]
MAEIDIIIVSWNVRDLLDRCLRSILAQGGSDPDGDGFAMGADRVRVHVIDNASSDGTVEMVRSFHPWVHLLASAENLGFTGGNNRALPQARGDYLLLLNPDTEMAPGALAAMQQALAASPRVGIVGPRLTYGDGSPQSSRRRFPTFPMALFESTLVEQWFPHNRWARLYRMEDTPEIAQRVDWLTGACLLTRRAIWDQIGPLDERFFMYSEELDWCRRAADAGWQCLYLPQAHVIHHEGQSSGQIVAQRHHLFNASKVLYWCKHHGRVKGELLRAFLLATFAIQLAVESSKWVLGHKRALRRDRIVAYRWLLGTGLRPSPAPKRRPND